MMFILSVLIALSVYCSAEYPGEIPGPRNLTHRVAIVGAGVAGIHMALKLKDKGFTDVTVYELENRVGGTTSQRTYRDTVFDSPSSYPVTNQKLKALVEKYLDPTDITELPLQTIWTKTTADSAEFAETTMLDYITNKAIERENLQNVGAIRQMLANNVGSLISIYKQYFPNSEEFLTEPNWMGKENTYGTVKEFLQRNNLYLLEPLMGFTLTLHGLGSIDEVSALYLFLNFDLKLWEGLERTFQNGFMDPDTKREYVINGFQQIWSRIASQENINVVLNSKVIRVRRLEKSSTTETVLTIRRTSDMSTYTEKYNFVIWTSNLKAALHTMHWKDSGANAGPFPEEYQTFQRSHPTLYKTTLLADTELLKRGPTPVNVLIDNIENKGNGPYMFDDQYALALKQTNQTAYRNGDYSQNADGSPYRTVQLTHYTKQMISNLNLQQITNEFQAVNVTSTGLNSIAVNPQFSSRDMTNSMIWKLLKMQGKYGMWYTGSSVTSETIEAMLNYNELLINKMVEPVGGGGGNQPEA